MKVLCAWALAGAALIAAGSANATNCSNASFKKLLFFSSDTGGILWQSPRVDSPLDSNNVRLLVHLLNQDGDDWAGAYSKCSGIEGKTIGQIRNLSFDFMNTTGNPDVHIGAGAPRYSVDLDADGDGVYDFSAYLAASYCNAPLAEDTRWSRADFTGRTLAGCELQADGVSYISDGAKSAWTLFAEAHPTYKVIGVGPAYLIMDEPGTTFVDRLAFHNIMYTSSGTGSSAIKSCPSESSC